MCGHGQLDEVEAIMKGEPEQRQPEMRDSILEVRELTVEFSTTDGMLVAVDHVSVNVPRGRTVALIGESGCGKSSTALSVLRLLPATGRVSGGNITFIPNPDDAGIDLTNLSDKEFESIRGSQIGMAFQGVSQCLNPAYTVGQEIVRALSVRGGLSRRAGRTAAIKLLERVGISDAETRVRQHPQQLSGGLQQRVMIALALACRPRLLIADEPTSALDLSTRAQIVKLLRDVQEDERLSILIATHDLGVAAELSDYVYVMYAGRIVEHGEAKAVLSRPAHPYTQALMRAVPRIDEATWRFQPIAGGVPDPINFPTGCRFHPRCPLSAQLAEAGARPTVSLEREDRVVKILESCRGAPDKSQRGPSLTLIGPRHYAACWEIDND